MLKYLAQVLKKLCVHSSFTKKYNALLSEAHIFAFLYTL